MEENRIPKRVLYMILGTTRLRGRPRNRWQDEVREDGRIFGGEGWQEKVHNREEWKKLVRGGLGCSTPPQKFRRPSKIVPNSTPL